MRIFKYVFKIKVGFVHSCKLMMMTRARGPRLMSWYPGPSLPGYTLIMRRQRLWPRPGSHPPSPGWQGQNKLSVNVPDQFEGIYGFTREFKEYSFYIPPMFALHIMQINYALHTCEISTGFSTENGKINICFPPIDDRIRFLQGSVCRLLVSHNDLETGESGFFNPTQEMQNILTRRFKI